MIFDKAMQKAHREAELERLRAGQESCGCSDCQEYYQTLDLSVYGERVKEYAGIIVIIEGKTGADKWNEYHKPHGWSPGGNVCIVDSQGYRVGKAGNTYCVGPVDENGKTVSGDDAQSHPVKPQNTVDSVPKIIHNKVPIPQHSDEQNGNYGTTKKRGRPRKTDSELSRRTLYRRKAEQGIMAI